MTSLRLSWSDAPAEVPSSPITSSDMDYFGEQVTTVSSQGERRSRQKSRNKLRAYLYGSSSHNSSQSLSSDEEEERRNSLVGAARGAKKRLSRTGSSIMQLSSAKGSTNYLTSASTPNLLVSDPEEATRMAEQIKERARLDKIAAQNHISSPVDEDKHVDSVMAPLRRKSLYTPGIATRQSSDILRKPPPPQSIQSQADRDYYYNPAYPATSPLAQLAALNHSNNGRDTPTKDVTHLGGLQLGTLRVTNGAASPVPPSIMSTRRHQRTTSELNSPDDFQTASEGGDVDDGATLMPPQHPNLATKSSSSTVDLFVPTNQAIENLKQDEQEPYSKRTSFPFLPNPSDHASAMATEYAAELGDFPFSHSESPPSKENTITNSRPFSYSETPSSIKTTIPINSVEGVGMALSSSQETRMHSWRSMIDDAEPSSAAKGTREDALSKLNGSSITSKHSLLVEPAPDVDSAYSSKASLGIGQHGIMTGPKIDSGYSSKASLGLGQQGMMMGDPSQELKPQRATLRSHVVSGLRDMPAAQSREEIAHVVTETPSRVRPSFTVNPQHAMTKAEPSVTSTGALQTISSARTSARAPSQVLMKKLQKARPKSQPPPPVNTITVQRYHDLEQVHIPRVPSLVAARHAERLVQFPLLDHTFPSSEHVHVSRASTLSHPYDVSIRFPSPANALESAAGGSTNSPVYSEPATMSPSKSKNHVADEDGEWGPSSLVKSPSWSAFGGSKQKKLQKKALKERKEAEKRQVKEEKEFEKRLAKDRKELEKQKKRNESKERSGRSRRSSWYRGKSSERRSTERDAQGTISDFGTVAESLGRSPYDIARSTQSSHYAPQQANWHPYQISTAMPRPKSMASMNMSVAATSSHAPSRPRSQSIGRTTIPVDETFGVGDDVRGRKIHARPQTMYADVPPVPALSAVDLRHHDLEWAQSRQRSRSVSKAQGDYHQSASSDSLGDVSGVSRRPQSMFVDAPPLPALPSLRHVKQRDIERTISRPQSMVVDSPPSLVSRPQSLVIDSPVEQSTASRQTREMSRSGVATLPALRQVKQREIQRTTSRPQSMIVDSPPSPVSHPQSLTVDFPVERPISSQQSREVSGSGVAAPPPKSRTSQMAVPDLWTSGSLEKKITKEVTPLEQPADPGSSAIKQDPQNSSNDMWGVQQQAWSERHKSAGEALFSKHQLRDVFHPEDPVAIAAPTQKPRPEPTSSKSVASSPSVVTKNTRRPVSSALAPSTANAAPIRREQKLPSHEPAPESYKDSNLSFPTPAERRRDQAKSSSIPRKRIGSGASTPRAISQNRSSVVVSSSTRPVSTSIDVDAPTTSSPLMQRYGGGLLYGYEPGQGLGGSAGTRGGQNIASRKSVELSKGYGIDLSDVPVFIVPATH